MKIYTKTGDDGTTALYGGERVSKDHLRVRAYGTVDEVNAHLGLARAHLADDGLTMVLENLQNTLFDVGADLATPENSHYRNNISALSETDVVKLEQQIDSFEADLAPLQNFILPGGHPASAALQLARAVTRRAERDVLSLHYQVPINQYLIHYLNRLSDLLFVLARVVNQRSGISETKWHVKARE
jgi:cob(I)alamin adenosyltransferase